MRIAGGMWRGRELLTQEGRDTRPTQARVRESCASSVLHEFSLDLHGVSVFDAYAGSGALGFEFLSRGAKQLVAVEKNRKSFACLKQNATKLKADPHLCTLLYADALQPRTYERVFQALAGSKIALVLLDPPYAFPVKDALQPLYLLKEAGCLDEHARVLYEHAASDTFSPQDVRAQERVLSCSVSVSRHISHGICAIEILRLDSLTDPLASSFD